MTPATATPTRRRPPRRRPTRPPASVRITVGTPPNATARERRLIRDTLRMFLAGTMETADVELNGGGSIVVTVGYSGVALNAGPLTAAAWALQTLDEAIPDDSPLADVIAAGNVKATACEAIR